MMVTMSEQALMDCSWGYGNNGCDGGETFRAYEWIMDNGCIPTEDTYGTYLQQVRWVWLVGGAECRAYNQITISTNLTFGIREIT